MESNRHQAGYKDIYKKQRTASVARENYECRVQPRCSQGWRESSGTTALCGRANYISE